MAFDYIAVEVYYDHVINGHGIIVNSAGLDYDETCLAVDAGDIAPGEYDESVLDEVKVSTKYFFFEFF